LRNVSALLLKLLVLCEVLDILLFIRVENISLLGMALSALHQLFNRVELLVHGNTFSHDTIFLNANVDDLVQAVLDRDNHG
jgi:hypothetical protein